jgi:hypothetical protein
MLYHTNSTIQQIKDINLAFVKCKPLKCNCVLHQNMSHEKKYGVLNCTHDYTCMISSLSIFICEIKDAETGVLVTRTKEGKSIQHIGLLM